MRVSQAFLAVFALALLVLAGCSQSIDSVKTEDMIGEEVTVSGEVTESVKIGELSGYVVSDETGSISVASDSLPAEGDTVRVSGTLLRDSIFGYYLQP